MLSLLFNQGAPVQIVAAGVAANAAIGSGRIDVTFSLTGVHANAAIGAVRVDVVFTLTGVHANAAIGAVRIDVAFTLTGVAANAAIGAVRIDVAFSVTGVHANAAIGAVRVDVVFVLTGVAANAAIGNGTITGAITVGPPAAAPVLIENSGSDGNWISYPRGLRRRRVMPYYAVPETEVLILAPGAMAAPGIGGVMILTARPATWEPNHRPIQVKRKGISAVSKIGSGEILSVVDLTEEEIVFLLAA